MSVPLKIIRRTALDGVDWHLVCTQVRGNHYRRVDFTKFRTKAKARVHLTYLTQLKGSIYVAAV